MTYDAQVGTNITKMHIIYKYIIFKIKFVFHRIFEIINKKCIKVGTRQKYYFFILLLFFVKLTTAIFLLLNKISSIYCKFSNKKYNLKEIYRE